MNKRLILESLRDIEIAILMELQSIANIPFSNGYLDSILHELQCYVLCFVRALGVWYATGYYHTGERLSCLPNPKQPSREKVCSLRKI